MSAQRIPEPIKLPLLTRLLNAKRWSEVLKDQLIWMMVGCLLIFMLTKTLPGHPILVITPSVPTGVYWLDRTAQGFRAGEYVTFEFNPSNKELSRRYAPNTLWHTKMVRATEGYVIASDSLLHLTACSPEIWGKPVCVDAGVAQTKDSKGRVLEPWLAPGARYVLKRDELWVYGPHPHSLDSRYHGPILAPDMKGKAKPLWLF